jgi:hypothetical protein
MKYLTTSGNSLSRFFMVFTLFPFPPGETPSHLGEGWEGGKKLKTGMKIT